MRKILGSKILCRTARPLKRQFASVAKRATVVESGPLYSNKVTIRNHQFVIDVPESEGGGNQGPGAYVAKGRFCRSRPYQFQLNFCLSTESDVSASLLSYEYLLASLGGCTSITCRMYAKHKRIPLDQIVVDVTYRRVSPTDPEWSSGLRDVFTREIEFIGPGLTEDEISRLTIIADKCPVHHALTSDHSQVITKIKLPT